MGDDDATKHATPKNPATKPHYFDRKPSDAITAVQVRRFADIVGANSPALHLDTLQRLLTHQGVSSTARAVIEAALNG